MNGTDINAVQRAISYIQFIQWCLIPSCMRGAMIREWCK